MLANAMDQIRYGRNGNRFLVTLSLSLFLLIFVSGYFMVYSVKQRNKLSVYAKKYEDLVQIKKDVVKSLQESQENFRTSKEKLMKMNDITSQYTTVNEGLKSCLNKLTATSFHKKQLLEELDTLTKKVLHSKQTEEYNELVREKNIKKIAYFENKILELEKENKKQLSEHKKQQALFQEMQKAMSLTNSMIGKKSLKV